LPKKPAVLPCGHEFCKGCVLDLTIHAKLVKQTPGCPICRGPLERESFKEVWKRACHHQQSGCTLIGFGAASSPTTLGGGDDDDESSSYYRETTPTTTSDGHSLSFLTNEVIREFTVAAKQFGECLSILDAEAARPINKETYKEFKNKQYKVATLMKLQEVLKYHVLPETQYERRIQLLKEAILLSNIPIPKAHLEVGKIFLLEQDGESLTLAIAEFQIILDLAGRSRLSSGAKHAKKLRGQTHYHVALAYQLEGMIGLAADHYDLAHKYKSCKDYSMAAKCHSHMGNLQKAVDFGRLALSKEQEQDNVKCDTHLLLIVIYEKLFLVEQMEGNLNESKHYKFHQEVEHYCDSLIGAKNLASGPHERSEIILRMDTFQGLIPWKRSLMEHHFKAWSMVISVSCRMNRSAVFTEESRSENTYTMGEMEDSLCSNSLDSNSFDNANDDCDDDGEEYYHDDDEEEYASDYEDHHHRHEMESKGAHSELSDDDTGDWISEDDSRSFLTLEREESVKGENGQFDQVESEPKAVDSKENVAKEEDSEPDSDDENHDAKEETDDSIEASQHDSIPEIEVDEDHDDKAETRDAMEAAEDSKPEPESNDANHGEVNSIEACMKASPDDSNHETAEKQNKDDKIADADQVRWVEGVADDDQDQLSDKFTTSDDCDDNNTDLDDGPDISHKMEDVPNEIELIEE